MTPCFYCGIAMTVNKSGNAGNLRPTDQTNDHVIPKSLLKYVRNDYQSYSRVADKTRVLNTVHACRACNHYKGALSPLDWLVIMPSNEGASRLGELLMKMGCTIDEVAKAMGRRG